MQKEASISWFKNCNTKIDIAKVSAQNEPSFCLFVVCVCVCLSCQKQNVVSIFFYMLFSCLWKTAARPCVFLAGVSFLQCLHLPQRPQTQGLHLDLVLALLGPPYWWRHWWGHGYWWGHRPAAKNWAGWAVNTLVVVVSGNSHSQFHWSLWLVLVVAQ